MKIRWLDDAIADLRALRYYIQQQHTIAAKQVVKKIVNSVQLLSEQPEIGRQGRVKNTRELVISDIPYIVPYRVKNGVLEVLRVFHSAMEWPEEFNEKHHH